MTNLDRSETPLAQLIVGGWSTDCSHCGGNADATEDFHHHGGPRGAYSSGSSLSDTNGCGARFTNTDDEIVQRIRAR